MKIMNRHVLKSHYCQTCGMCLVLGLLLLSIFLHPAISQELYGASVYWRPTESSKLSTAFTYHLIWKGEDRIEQMKKKCPNDACKNSIDIIFHTGYQRTNDRKISPKIFPNYTWLCTRGCNPEKRVLSNLSELYFTDAASFDTDVWESGVETVEINFNALDDTDNIGIGFTFPNGTLVDGLSEVSLSMAVRNDTKRPNISPLVNVFPVYRVPMGCTITIRLYPFDGDGDEVSCHWQTTPEKSRPASNAYLNSPACEITFVANSSHVKQGDVVYFSLFAQDYLQSPVELIGVTSSISKGPFSTTPIKLRVSVGNATTSCQLHAPVFNNNQSMRANFKKSYEAGNLKSGIETYLPFSTLNTNDTILTSGPRYMVFETERNYSLITYGVWKNLSDNTMKGIHQVCGMVYSSDGVPGESRCAVLLISEPDECNTPTNPCGEDVVCGNFFEHNTCSYNYIRVTDIRSLSGQCNSGTTIEKGDNGLKIGLPVGLFLLLLLLLIALTLYLRHKWTEKMRTNDVGEDTSVSAVAKKVF